MVRSIDPTSHSRRNDLMATKAKTKKVKDLSAKGGRINRA
jgi:hypothetical protein